MDDLQNGATHPGQAIASIATKDIPAFIREQIAERELLPLIRSLNADVLSGDAVRRTQAEDALRHLGFL